LCDGIDNNCDGNVDETFPTKGQACDNGLLGVCRGTGSQQCRVDESGLECVITSPGEENPGAESCNGLDDDCDGVVDDALDDSDLRRVTGTVGSVSVDVWMEIWEASRPDATSLLPGSLESHSCSRPGVLPWASVSQSRAEEICEQRGRRLCSAEELQLACSGATGNSYPYGSTYQATACNGLDYSVTAGTQSRALPAGTLSTCVSTGQILDLTGNVAEWSSTRTNDLAESPGIFEVRGGSFESPAGGLLCAFDFPRLPAPALTPTVGFRCCKAP